MDQMKNESQESGQSMAANFTAQIYSVATRKDGGGKVVLEFSADALGEVQKIQRWNALDGLNIAVAVVPYKD